MCNTLTLKPSGTNGCIPDEDPWKPRRKAVVTITNSSGHKQTLSNICPPGCLFQTGGKPADSIPLDNNESWTGRAGSIKGSYDYDDGSPSSDIRSGTIDPS